MAEDNKRLRYFNGQFLQEQDFNDEQRYHLERQRRHNQLFHTHGIAEGLTVEANAGSATATVLPGAAIDSLGRMIILPQSQSVSFPSLPNQSVLVVISYGEQESDPATVGVEGNTRWLERPRIEVVGEAQAQDARLFIRLARLQLAANNTVSQLDATVRTMAGRLDTGSLKVQTPLGAAPQSVQDQNGTRSSLAIGTKRVEISTDADQEAALNVIGRVGNAPVVTLHSKKNESSIRYSTDDPGGLPWHAGTGGHAGLENFFFWNQRKGVVARMNPEGTLTVNNLATPDGRNFKSDRDTLDALNSATLEGVSNPGGNIDLIGENGITVTGDNAANTIRISNTAGSLTVPSGIKDEPALVQDQAGIPSALKIGKNIVEVKTDVERHVVLKVTGKTTNGPVEELHSTGNESSIRYSVAGGTAPWHVGTGGLGGAKNFFFWNESNGVIAKITPEGNLVATSFATPDGRDIKGDREKLDALANATLEGVSNPGGNIDLIGQNGITVAGNNDVNTITIANAPGSLVVQDGIKDEPKVVQDQMGISSSLKIGKNNVEVSAGDERHVVLKVSGKATDGPLEELHSTGNESSIRYSVAGAGVPWHVGTGGHGGAKNFFFWNQQKGIVATITPEGTLTIKGDLVVDGGLSMRRTVVMASFSQGDADGTIKTVETGFRPKFISMEGRSHAWLGTTNARLSYGGAVGGFCHASDDGTIVRMAGHGPHVARFGEPPYLTFYNEVHPAQYKTFGSTGFVDHVVNPKLHVYLEISVESTTSTGFKLKLFRKSDPGFTPPSVFSVDMAFAVLG